MSKETKRFIVLFAGTIAIGLTSAAAYSLLIKVADKV